MRRTNFLQRLHLDQRGLTTVEYVIVLCLIAAVAVKTWGVFGTKVQAALGDSNAKIGSELDAAKKKGS